MTKYRIAELINGVANESTVFGVQINEDYFITVSHRTYYRDGDANTCYRMNLVRDAKTGCNLDNEIIAYETIKENASDRVVINRYNKLVAKIR